MYACYRCVIGWLIIFRINRDEEYRPVFRMSLATYVVTVNATQPVDCSWHEITQMLIITNTTCDEKWVLQYISQLISTFLTLAATAARALRDCIFTFITFAWHHNQAAVLQHSNVKTPQPRNIQIRHCIYSWAWLNNANSVGTAFWIVIIIIHKWQRRGLFRCSIRIDYTPAGNTRILWNFLKLLIATY